MVTAALLFAAGISQLFTVQRLGPEDNPTNCGNAFNTSSAAPVCEWRSISWWFAGIAATIAVALIATDAVRRWRRNRAAPTSN